MRLKRPDPAEILARIAARQVDDMIRWPHFRETAFGMVFGAWSALYETTPEHEHERIDAVYARWSEFRKALEES